MQHFMLHYTFSLATILQDRSTTSATFLVVHLTAHCILQGVSIVVAPLAFFKILSDTATESVFNILAMFKKKNKFLKRQHCPCTTRVKALS